MRLGLCVAAATVVFGTTQMAYASFWMGKVLQVDDNCVYLTGAAYSDAPPPCVTGFEQVDHAAVACFPQGLLTVAMRSELYEAAHRPLRQVVIYTDRTCIAVPGAEDAAEISSWEWPMNPDELPVGTVERQLAWEWAYAKSYDETRHMHAAAAKEVARGHVGG